jgi:hypothetical protein
VTCKKKPPKYFELSKLARGRARRRWRSMPPGPTRRLLKTACGKGFPEPKEVFGTLRKGDAYVPWGFEEGADHHRSRHAEGFAAALALATSLRAKRSNPCFPRGQIDCFVAALPRNDG